MLCALFAPLPPETWGGPCLARDLLRLKRRVRWGCDRIGVVTDDAFHFPEIRAHDSKVSLRRHGLKIVCFTICRVLFEFDSGICRCLIVSLN